jgi:hypothetical protein
MLLEKNLRFPLRVAGAQGRGSRDTFLQRKGSDCCVGEKLTFSSTTHENFLFVFSSPAPHGSIFLCEQDL